VSPYNADFDGDEMNAHIPQSYEAATELEQIAAVKHQIIGPREGKPSIGIVQDTLVGTYRITKDDTQFTRREYMNLMMYNKNFEGLPKAGASAAAAPGGERWTGHQVVSSLLPPINMDMGNKSFDDDPSARNKVKIVEGQILNGIIDKDIFSKAGKGIVHVSYNDYGSDQTVDMIDSMQLTIESFLVLNGFSVGISDMIADDKTRQQMDEVIQARKKEVNELNLQVHLDLFDNNTGKSNQDEFEARVFASLNKATKESGEFGQLALADENRLVAMVKAGSKGGPINIAQMIACVGQQNIEGRRIPYGFNDRTLPHYKKYDDGPEARGFIESSFIGGLSPQEFFFHAMSGREGLIDTAVKSVTGDTEIVIIEDGVAKKVEIGPWIDAQLATASNVEKYDATQANLELLNIETDVTIPTVDADGNSSWGKITAITRHDPGDKIYAIKTQGGRDVIVSAGKSLLIWDENTKKFGEKLTPEVKVGNYVPVTVKLPTPPITTGIDIQHFISNLNSVENINFQSHNDVVLDAIVEINEMTPDNYPKLYDLTVPITLNFGLANGLQVRDTADTGYIQRQLVKAMEDLTVQHDGTVRDANMNIVQFHYGEDGLNATKIEGTSIGYAKLSEKDIRREFGLAKVDFTPILTDAVISTDSTNYEQTAEMKTYVDQILEDRKMIVERVFSSGRQGGVFGPLNPERLIMNLRIRFGLKSDLKTDLTPTYVLQGLNKLIERTQPYHKLWCALVRFHFAPHKLIVKDRFTKAAFDALMELCLLKNLKASSLPGELVGIIAAQSIGEPSTQMSSIYSSRIAVRNVKTNKHFVGPIGKLIDDILENNKSNVIQIGENNVVLDLDMENGYEIIGVSNDEKTSWKKISQVSRHPANGGLVEITTKSGRKTTATLTHSFLTRGPKGVIPILGSELKVGTRVPIARQIPEVASPLYSLTENLTTFELTKEFGWLCGIYLADGSLNGNTVNICKIHPIVEEKIRAIADVYKWDITVRNYEGAYGPSKNIIVPSKDLKQFLYKHFSTGSYEKKIAAPVFQSNLAFIQGIIAGYFDGDGNVNVERQQIRVGSRSKTLIHDIAALLSYAGIFGAFGEETSIRIPGKILYTYQILKKYAAQFRTTIGLHLNEKAAALDAIVDYMERDGKHDTKEIYDKIPELGEIIAETGRLLTMPGQSRNFGRWAKKESIGRLTLQGYIEDFEEVLATRTLEPQTEITVRENIAILRSAAYSDIVWDEIVELNILEDPKEFVYDFTVPGNDSFMVDDNILVHNTLNSVDYDTEIIIMKNGKVWTPEIGEFIDNYYEALPEDSNVVQKLPNNQIYIELNDGNDWKALSTDEDGKMMWTKLEAITRHPVVNEDGSNTILEVKLESGRIIKATKALSFLTNVNGKIEGIKGSDLKVGDEIPIANSLDIGEYIIKEINLRDILSPTEWLYGTDVNRALETMREYNNIGDRHWFQINQGKLFTVPYKRSDVFRDAFENGRNTNTVKDGCVYPKRTRPDTSHIPETISLTGEFGFFVGAYVAEGMSNSTQINITNNDAGYIQKVKDLMDKWNVGTHIVSEDRYCEKTGIKGHTTSLVIHSTLLAKIMGHYFGKVSYEKTLPDWVLQASDEFVKGLVDGYISGDGTVCAKTGGVSASSVSETLIVKMMALLARYGIFSTMYSYTPQLNKFNSVSTQYSFRILTKYSKVFAETFTLSIVNKQEKLEYHFMYNDNERTCMREYQNNIVWDKVKSIKEVLPLRGWVYDLTVEKTRHFTGLNLINLYDTFHLAGVAAKSNVTRGVPRLKELLKVTENPKAISITGYLKPEFRQNKDKVREVVQDLELTLLRDITVKAAIYYDPSDDKSIVSEDSELIQFYKLFEERENEAAPTDDGVKWSNWLVRLELDRERMFNKNISMDDISFILNDRFSENINLVYSDFNSKKLIMRIRLTTDEKTLGFGDDLAGIKKFQNKILNGIVIRGVPGIRSATFRKHADLLEYVDGEYKPIEQYVIDTDGSNFLEVMNHPAIDGTRIYTTHVHDIYNNLGVEAARAVLMSELVGLFEEAGVNYRHLGLLCDVMTHKGRFMMVARYGINKNDIGPLAKASFEETEKILLNAALFGEVDPITGVSANIMTGQAIRAGTSFSQILLDESALGRLLQGLPPTEEGEEEEEGAELTQSMINSELYEDSNDACATTQLRMNITIPGDIPIMEEPDGELTILE
jgi:DNA-directed RNA polymerase beta' subunit